MDKNIRGLVLREVRYKEADRILTVLTPEGKMTVKAPGALRKTSKFGAATQQLTYSDMNLYSRGGGRWQVREGSVLEDFRGLRMDLEKLALGCYLAQVLEAVSDEDNPSPVLLQLGLNSLYAMSRDLCPMWQVKAVFELRLAALTGYAPELGRCMLCGEAQEELYFDVQQGGLVCAHCGGRYGQPISGPCLAAMRHVVQADPKKIFSFTLTGEAAEEFADRCERYLLCQLDRSFPALDYYKSVRIP